MLVYCRGFVAFDCGDEPPRYERAEFLFPREVPEEDLEGVMYDVACITYDDNECFDWVAVVAYDAATAKPIVAIDFGRRYATTKTTEFGPVWAPSRDYWHGEEIPDSLR